MKSDLKVCLVIFCLSLKRQPLKIHLLHVKTIKELGTIENRSAFTDTC